jgi:predicted transcriptional regulator
MIRSRTVNKIADLYTQGKSIQDIAIELGIARNTVRKYLRHPALAAMPHPRPNRRSKFPRVAQRAASQEISGSPGCFTHTAPLLLASWAEFQDRIRPIAETLSGAVLAR